MNLDKDIIYRFLKSYFESFDDFSDNGTEITGLDVIGFLKEMLYNAVNSTLAEIGLISINDSETFDNALESWNERSYIIANNDYIDDIKFEYQNMQTSNNDTLDSDISYNIYSNNPFGDRLDWTLNISCDKKGLRLSIWNERFVDDKFTLYITNDLASSIGESIGNYTMLVIINMIGSFQIAAELTLLDLIKAYDVNDCVNCDKLNNALHDFSYESDFIKGLEKYCDFADNPSSPINDKRYSIFNSKYREFVDDIYPQLTTYGDEEVMDEEENDTSNNEKDTNEDPRIIGIIDNLNTCLDEAALEASKGGTELHFSYADELKEDIRTLLTLDDSYKLTVAKMRAMKINAVESHNIMTFDIPSLVLLKMDGKEDTTGDIVFPNSFDDDSTYKHALSNIYDWNIRNSGAIGEVADAMSCILDEEKNEETKSILGNNNKDSSSNSKPNSNVPIPPTNGSETINISVNKEDSEFEPIKFIEKCADAFIDSNYYANFITQLNISSFDARNMKDELSKYLNNITISDFYKTDLESRELDLQEIFSTSSIIMNVTSANRIIESYLFIIRDNKYRLVRITDKILYSVGTERTIYKACGVKPYKIGLNICSCGGQCNFNLEPLAEYYKINNIDIKDLYKLLYTTFIIRYDIVFICLSILHNIFSLTENMTRYNNEGHYIGLNSLTSVEFLKHYDYSECIKAFERLINNKEIGLNILEPVRKCLEVYIEDFSSEKGLTSGLTHQSGIDCNNFEIQTVLPNNDICFHTNKGNYGYFESIGNRSCSGLSPILMKDSSYFTIVIFNSMTDKTFNNIITIEDTGNIPTIEFVRQLLSIVKYSEYLIKSKDNNDIDTDSE